LAYIPEKAMICDNVSDAISQAFLPFRFVDIIVITDHGLFWNVGQANCILKYFENMVIDHSDSTIFLLSQNGNKTVLLMLFVIMTGLFPQINSLICLV
jgi:hypothetical protein